MSNQSYYHYYLQTQPGYVVAFLDILGFSSLINSNDSVAINSSGVIYSVPPIYEYITNHYTEKNQVQSKIKFLWVSDSIFITDKQENIAILIQAMSEIIHYLYCTNLSIRGGIATGSLYFEKNLWGTAVVKAVSLEKDAYTPRVIMKKEDFEVISPNMNEEINFWHPDGAYYYFDYFGRFFYKEIQKPCDDLDSILSVYSRCIQENFKAACDKSVKNKWCYLAKFLSKHIQDNREYINSHSAYAKKRAQVFGINTANMQNTDIYLSILDDAASYMEE